MIQRCLEGRGGGEGKGGKKTAKEKLVAHITMAACTVNTLLLAHIWQESQSLFTGTVGRSVSLFLLCSLVQYIYFFTIYQFYCECHLVVSFHQGFWAAALDEKYISTQFMTTSKRWVFGGVLYLAHSALLIRRKRCMRRQ